VVKARKEQEACMAREHGPALLCHIRLSEIHKTPANHHNADLSSSKQNRRYSIIKTLLIKTGFKSIAVLEKKKKKQKKGCDLHPILISS